MYGENSAALRGELATLLRYHRHQQRAGDRFNLTLAERRPAAAVVASQEILRYRYSVLVWCRQALRTTTPHVDLDRRAERTRGPREELRYRLNEAIKASDSGIASLDDLTTRHDSPVVESWRLAAKAAALGEHDFTAPLSHAALPADQALTVVKDIAEIVQAVVALDLRYAELPAWQALKEPRLLARAAAVCATYAGFNTPDFLIDLRGWQPPTRFDHRPAQPGLEGLLQSENNLLVCLQQFPDAYSLRLVLDSQRILSHAAARQIRETDPALAETWQQRSQTYQSLIRETRNLGSLIGNGTRAAGQASIAANRAHNLTQDHNSDQHHVTDLTHLFNRIDERLADIVVQGVEEFTYLRRVTLPRFDGQTAALVQQRRARYVPMKPPLDNPLKQIAQTQLKPRSGPARAPRDAARSRHEFEQALVGFTAPITRTTEPPGL